MAACDRIGRGPAPSVERRRGIGRPYELHAWQPCCSSAGLHPDQGSLWRALQGARPVPHIGSRVVDIRLPGSLHKPLWYVVQVVCKTLFEQGRLTLVELRKLTGAFRWCEHACQAEYLYPTFSLHTGLAGGDVRAALLVLLQQNCLTVRTAVPEGGPGALLAAQTLYQVDILSILAYLRCHCTIAARPAQQATRPFGASVRPLWCLVQSSFTAAGWSVCSWCMPCKVLDQMWPSCMFAVTATCSS